MMIQFETSVSWVGARKSCSSADYGHVYHWIVDLRSLAPVLSGIDVTPMNRFDAYIIERVDADTVAWPQSLGSQPSDELPCNLSRRSGSDISRSITGVYQDLRSIKR